MARLTGKAQIAMAARDSCPSRFLGGVLRPPGGAGLQLGENLARLDGFFQKLVAYPTPRRAAVESTLREATLHTERA